MLGWELPPHNSGGLGVACYQLCKALSEKGVSIEFILPYQADFSSIDFMKVRAARPISFSELPVTASAYDSHKYVASDGRIEWFDIHDQQAAYETAIGKIVPLLDFDVIHAHDWLTFRAGLRARTVSGKPLIVHVHSVEADRAGEPGGGNALVREIEATSFMLADRIIAVSQFTREAIAREYDIPLSKIDVVYNSLDRDMVASLETDTVHRYLSQMRSEGFQVVVNIGRLTIQKGLPNLLRAAQRVIERSPKTLFLIVGSGEQYHELIELAAELGISKHVIFTGFQRGKPWRDSFAIGDLFVMPSVSEPFGLTPLEAAGYGTPSLISRQSGVAEVFLNSLKVDYWDTDEMANQILAVLTSEALKKELQINAKKEYDQLSWSPSADRLLNWYHHHHAAVLSELVA